MYNTGNPLGSKDILDLYDNSENIDQFTNSQQDEIPDRFGVKRLTLAGLIKRSMALRNEINDFSGALTFKPEWSDVPMNVSEGVGGEGGALNLQAEALGNRSEINKVTSREALRRSYAEAGYNLVAGSFEAGGTLVNANDVLLQERTGKAFSGPAGTVAAGTNPASGGFVDKSGVATSASAISNANGGSVQDFIDEFSNVEERLLGVGAKIYRGSNGQYVQNGDTVPAGTTHLAVLINGKPEEVAMSPIASGIVSLLTETSATIGLTPVKFSNVKTKTFPYLYNIDGDLVIDRLVSLGDMVVVDNYHEDGTSGTLFFRVVAASTGTPDGGKYIDLPLSNLQLEQNLRKPYDVKAWGAKGNDPAYDELPHLTNALAYLNDFDSLWFSGGKYHISSQLPDLLANGVCLFADNRYNAGIFPHADWDGSNALLQIGDGTTYGCKVRNLTFDTAQGSLGNDADGLIIHPFYNFDIDGCLLKSGNYVTRETAGLRIKGNALHTRVLHSQLHNGYCYGMIIEGHGNGLKVIDCAFDESPLSVKSTGNIVEALFSQNEFGSALENNTYPTPSNNINVDLRTGIHGSIVFYGNTFQGGDDTKFHIRWADVSSMCVIGNLLRNASRYSLVSDGPSRPLSIVGNAFTGNGTETVTTNAALGIRDPDASDFCADVYLHSAFQQPVTISNNTSRISNRPSFWIEGTSSNLVNSGVTLVGNSSIYQSNIAYIHGSYIKSTEALLNGEKDSVSNRRTMTIKARTVLSGTEEFGNSASDREILTTSNIAWNITGTNLPSGLVVRVIVLSSGFARWYLYNPTASDITISTDVTINYRVIN